MEWAWEGARVQMLVLVSPRAQGWAVTVCALGADDVCVAHGLCQTEHY